MILKIGDIDVSKFILPPDIADTFRSQSVNQTLNGSLVVDRISEPQGFRLRAVAVNLDHNSELPPGALNLR